MLREKQGLGNSWDWECSTTKTSASHFYKRFHPALWGEPGTRVLCTPEHCNARYQYRFQWHSIWKLKYTELSLHSEPSSCTLTIKLHLPQPLLSPPPPPSKTGNYAPTPIPVPMVSLFTAEGVSCTDSESGCYPNMGNATTWGTSHCTMNPPHCLMWIVMTHSPQTYICRYILLFKFWNILG